MTNTSGAVKKRTMSADRKLRFLSEYMGEWVDAWPKKIKPFDTWLESILDKRIHKGKVAEREIFRQTCRYCHQLFEPYNIDLLKTKDHIIPLSKGGYDIKENRVPACFNCNQWKSDKLPEEWLKEVKVWAKKKVDNPKYTVAQIGIMVFNIRAVMKYAKDNNKKLSMYKI
jgi:hypothetical protein